MSKEKLISDTVLNDPATIDGIKNLIDKTTPLIQAGRFDNIVDLLSLISDNIAFLDEAALQKTTKIVEEIMVLGWTGGNAVRMANAQTEALEKPPGLFQLMSSLNDPDVRRALHFFIGTMRIVGQQTKKALKSVPPGEILEVRSTDPGSVIDFTVFCNQTGNELVSSRIEGNIYRFEIKRSWPHV